ncbi:hypothetical protein CerSpe_047250 [Prunus speciosa]
MWDCSPFLFSQDTGLTIHSPWGPASSLAHFRSGSGYDIINDHVSSGTWKSVNVARNGPAISHLFSADDLILFGEASIHQAKLMKHCLDLFCGASGQQVNFDKSRICCSPNTDSGIAC